MQGPLSTAGEALQEGTPPRPHPVQVRLPKQVPPPLPIHGRSSPCTAQPRDMRPGVHTPPRGGSGTQVDVSTESCRHHGQRVWREAEPPWPHRDMPARERTTVIMDAPTDSKLLRIRAECSPLHMPEAKAMLRVRGQDRESHDRLLIWELFPTRLRSLQPHHALHRPGSRRPFPAAASRSGHVSRAAKPRGPVGRRFLRIFRVQAPQRQDPCSFTWREGPRTHICKGHSARRVLPTTGDTEPRTFRLSQTSPFPRGARPAAEPGPDLRRRSAHMSSREPGSSRGEEDTPGAEEDAREKTRPEVTQRPVYSVMGRREGGN